MIKENKKLSIIVPVYNAEKYMEKCLDRLLEQSYKNIEIIIVNDCSQGNCEDIAEKYKKIDDRVKYIKHEKNKGLFQARITGSSIATGDYIAFLDSDDYVSIDYYRTLINNIQENDSDIAMGNMVLEYDDGRREIYNLFDTKHLNLAGEDCLEQYFEQEGLSFDWHIIWNKIYKMEIWKKALKHYKNITTHLLMTEDFAFSTVLFYYARRLTKVSNDCVFYCKHETTSTSIKDLTFKKFNKNISDITTSFNFVENFLKEVNSYDKYKMKFNKWKCLYANQQKFYVKSSGMNKEEKQKAMEMIKSFYPTDEKISNAEYFYTVTTDWNDGLEKIKLAICDKNIKCVSFDIFDTLIKRPFFVPTDLFLLLNKYFREYTNGTTGMDFSKIRIYCEQLARERIENEECQEITLDQIYDTIATEYGIEKNVLDKLKSKEMEYEVRFCTRRNTGYELYTLALAMGKKVIFTSDMYLSRETINKILEKNGYIDNEKLYLSSEIKLSKSKGDLFKYVLSDLKIESAQMLHIGDNYGPDVEIPRKLKINSMHLPKATDVAQNQEKVNLFSKMLMQNMPFWRDNAAAMNFVGIRTMLAIVANKYFDNPFTAFNKYSDFNADPYLIGYYILGMYTFGISKWLLDETEGQGYTNMVFMARDGYLPMEAYKIMKKFYKNVPEEKYLYVSRKALVPITIMSKLDFYKLPECINVTKHTPREILKYLKDCIKENCDIEEILKKNNIEIDKKLKDIMSFNIFIKVVIDNLYDEQKHMNNLSKLKTYFDKFYENKSATFDVGYSARPELFLSNLCKKPIDTFFLNVNKDEAFRHSDMASFKLKTFFSGKPSATGFAYESMVSALAPSCIGYNINGNEVEPIFEKYDKTYQEEFVISIMQNAAIEFIQDITKIFGEEIKELYYEKYYVSLPVMAYINSAKEIDKSIFNAIYFEDDVRLNEPVKMTTEWNKELGYRNQRPMQELIYGGFSRNEGYSGYLNYNRYPDLEHHSKPVRFIYYILYDRETFKRRMRETFKNHKTLFSIGKGIYNFSGKFKRTVYKGIHKIRGGQK